jgi:Fe2+ or Zn2+ uptake regulation protein
MISLRLQMPDAFISLLIDDNTKSAITGKREEILKIINELKSVTVDDRFDKKSRSRWLKTSMRQNIEGDFLYIDGDTIIAENLSSLDDFDAAIAAVPDAHIYLSDYEKYYPARLNQMKAKYKKLGFSSCFDLNIHFNGGIFLCRDCKTAHDFFNEWHRLWLYCYEKNNITDQQSLNQSNFILGGVIKELDGIWNCQILYDGALRFLHDAKIIHYFASQDGEKAFIPANNNFFNSIKETGIVNQDLIDMLKNPKSLFASNTRLILVDRSLRGFYDSALCGAAKRIYHTKPGAAIEFIFFRIRKYIFTPLRKKLSK